ncbi:MAG: DUF4159 domain-containing protein [Alphaproteobacteria bacterium]|nr:DUF4159 domain-containing protein [Alphaproteobacteria bacterium]
MARDELAFFPLLYWPIWKTAPAPSPTLARIDTYMRNGGPSCSTPPTRCPSAFPDLAPAGRSPATCRARRARYSRLSLRPRRSRADQGFICSTASGRYAGSPLWSRRANATPAVCRAGR